MLLYLIFFDLTMTNSSTYFFPSAVAFATMLKAKNAITVSVDITLAKGLCPGHHWLPRIKTSN
eukprot:XP_001706831.1 Hypothetical protein GL50803_39591 [Giardia lamblia ATCC 50803]